MYHDIYPQTLFRNAKHFLTTCTLTLTLRQHYSDDYYNHDKVLMLDF